jgi:hypothetical protein
MPRSLGNYNTLFDGDGNGTDRTMPAHGQTAAGLNKKHRGIVAIVDGWINDAATHHIVTTRLEHKTAADPIEFL